MSFLNVEAKSGPVAVRVEFKTVHEIEWMSLKTFFWALNWILNELPDAIANNEFLPSHIESLLLFPKYGSYFFLQFGKCLPFFHPMGLFEILRRLLKAF